MTLTSRALWTLLCLSLAFGCGARTELNTDFDGSVPDDVGMDTTPDAADADVDTMPSELTVDCGRRMQFTTIRLPIMLEATVMTDAEIVDDGWTLRTSPEGSMSTNRPTSGASTTLTPDSLGEYLLRYEARDSLGRRASCEVLVESIVGPPRALCPEGELRGVVGAPFDLIGDGFDDFEVVVATWEPVESPRGANVELEFDRPLGYVARFTGDTVGTYRFRLTVVDEDMASDFCEVEVYLTAPPIVECPGDAIRAPTRQPVEVRARATDDSRVRRTTWRLLDQPARSSAMLESDGGSSTTFTPDRQGEYVLEFTALDDDGLSSSCLITVIGTPTPPTAICPESVETPPLSEVEVEGAAEDDGEIVRWSWRRVDRPMGSAAGQPSPGNRPATRFTPDIAGVYQLELTVTDDDGQTGTCRTNVIAAATEGLRVEMFWNSDRTDMDTHLLNPEATQWFSTEDCYYANCVRRGLDWGEPGDIDDPSLDIDDTDGFGPENINIDEPVNGTYRVGVHAFNGSAGRVTVRIYCGGSTTEPEATIGPVAITSDESHFWRVADVDIRGAACTVTELRRAGRPDIRTRRSAESER